MRRRTFLQGLGTATLIHTVPSWSQDRRTIVIGFVSGLSETDRSYLKTSIQKGLKVARLADGKNVKVEYRWTGGDRDLLDGIIRELVELDPDAIICDGTRVAIATRKVTEHIPLIFLTGGDPVKLGFVESLNVPGGHMTGYLLVNTDLTAKRTTLLLELLPGTKTVAFLSNRRNPSLEIHKDEFRRATEADDRIARIFEVENDTEIADAYSALSTLPGPALVVQGDQYFDSRRDWLIDLAARFTIPAIYQWREFPDHGGLISYGVSLEDAYKTLGELAGLIVTGHSVAELPVRTAQSFELVVNRQRAQTLAIDVPASILLRADEVIE